VKTRPAEARNPTTLDTGRASSRVAVIDGLRGVAILLVVLSHLTAVWPADERLPLGPGEWLFGSGNVAVSVFYVIAGFLASRSLMRGYDLHGVAGAATAFIRRWLRLALQVWFLLACVFVMSRVDPTDPYSDAASLDSILSSATHTFNTYVAHNALIARSDIGALYFIDIDVKFFVVATLVVCAFGRSRRALVGLAVVATVLCWGWRWYFAVHHDWFSASLATPVRMDGLLVGVLGGLVSSRIRLDPLRAGQLVGALALVVGGVVLAGPFLPILAYYSWLGPAVDLAVVGILLVVTRPASILSGSLAASALQHRTLVSLGARSLSIFLWHLPIFFAVARHTPSWSPALRTLVAVVATTIVVIIVEALVARPVTRWVGSLGRR
jgi:peptidoglycan/LPS O-acetylase OafA/YrhL